MLLLQLTFVSAKCPSRDRSSSHVRVLYLRDLACVVSQALANTRWHITQQEGRPTTTVETQKEQRTTTLAATREGGQLRVCNDGLENTGVANSPLSRTIESSSCVTAQMCAD